MDIPPISEFFGFALFYPAVIIGPVYDYATYNNFIYMDPKIRKKLWTIIPALKQFMIGSIFLYLKMSLSAYLNT